MSAEKKFIAHDNTKIGFGKLKGQPHSVLKLPENSNYLSWIVNQEDFFFVGTQAYAEKIYYESDKKMDGNPVPACYSDEKEDRKSVV